MEAEDEARELPKAIEIVDAPGKSFLLSVANTRISRARKANFDSDMIE
jgi:hypothetical protein